MSSKNYFKFREKGSKPRNFSRQGGQKNEKPDHAGDDSANQNSRRGGIFGGTDMGIFPLADAVSEDFQSGVGEFRRNHQPGRQSNQRPTRQRQMQPNPGHDDGGENRQMNLEVALLFDGASETAPRMRKPS